MNKHQLYQLCPHLLQFLFVMIVTGIISFIPSLSLASPEISTTVRVGYIFDGDYMYKNADGDYRGYEVEYLYTLAQEANWHISFIDYTNSEASLSALANGDIDILPGMAKTPDRQQQYLFSDKKMVTSYMTLMVRLEDARYSYGDIPSLQGMVTASRKGAVVVDIYRDWCAKNNLQPNLLLLDDYNEALEALLDGRADGMVVGGVYAFDKTRTVAQFFPSDSYFMISPKRPDIKQQLDEANDKLLMQTPLYELTLTQKYFSNSQGNIPLFTPQEKDYITTQKTIRVALLKDDPPYSYIGSDGSVQGVVPDYYKHIGTLSGLTVSFHVYATMADAVDAVNANQDDIMAIYEQDIFHAFQNGLSLTIPYADLNMVRISRNDSNSIHRIVVATQDADAVKAIKKTIPLSELIVLPNISDCFNALRNGRADAMLCDMQTATWFLNQDRASDYTILSIAETNWQLYSALDKNNVMLRSVLNKAIAASGNTFDDLLDHQNLQQQSQLTALFNKIPRTWAIIAALISMLALILVLIALWILIQRHRAEKLLAFKKAENERREAALMAIAKANETKFNFFSNLSHDMRTPLNGILGFTSLALESTNTQKLPEFLHKIEISGHLMLDLVNDMLTVARLEHAKLTLTLEPITLFQLLEHIATPIEVTAANAGVHFNLNKADAEDCLILADKLNVQKIFLNLIGNSIKFTAPGKTVHFIVKTNKTSDASISATMIVADEGKGISPDFLPHVFDAFAQEKDSQSSPTTGTGLGLAIVHQLVLLMGGTIDVVSTVGQGTTFTVQLPFSITDKPEKSQTVSEATSYNRDDVLQGKSILLCEDNEINAEITCHLLKAKGMSVACARNGQEGLTLFTTKAAGTFDAILMDNRMPVMGGIETTKAIRSLSRPDAQTIPIIALTADTFDNDITQFTEAGMSSYIIKPINPEQFYQTIAEELYKQENC